MQSLLVAYQILHAYKDEVNTLFHATKLLVMAAVVCGHTNTQYSMAFHVRSWHE